MNEVHVIPDERAIWRVYDTDAHAPISEHGNAPRPSSPRGRGPKTETQTGSSSTTATPARTRATPTPAGAGRREQLARARRLALVREQARELARAAR